VRTIKGTQHAKTLNNRLSVLNVLLTCAVNWKKIDSMPCRISMLDVDDQAEAAFYDHETYERLVAASAALDPRTHVAILLGGDGGLRRGEILALNLDDIDFKMARFHVRRSVYWRKAKPIPATPRLLAAFKACRHLRGERLLYTDENEPVTPKILKAWIIRAEVKAGLPKTGRLHVYRHTFASHLAMAGVPARTVQELCRHASLDITMRYMHLSPNAVEEGIEKLVESRGLGGQSVVQPRRREPST
jgi:integrase